MFENNSLDGISRASIRYHATKEIEVVGRLCTEIMQRSYLASHSLAGSMGRGSIDNKVFQIERGKNIVSKNYLVLSNILPSRCRILGCLR